MNTTQIDPRKMSPAQQMDVMKVTQILTQLVAGIEDQEVATMGLIACLISLTTAQGMSRETFEKTILAMYDSAMETAAKLGIKPGEPPPADLQERISSMMQQQHQKNGGQPSTP